MSRSRPHSALPAPWLRVLAALCAGLILLLGAVAHSPELHERLHHLAAAHDAGHDAHDHASPADDGEARGHDCAITLFAGGVTLANACLAAPAHPAAAPAVATVTHDRVALPEPRHLRPQPQAPPGV